MTVYPHALPPFGGITFAIKPGAYIQNVEVTVEPRIRIRGQVIFADGDPSFQRECYAQSTLSMARWNDEHSLNYFYMDGRCG